MSFQPPDGFKYHLRVCVVSRFSRIWLFVTLWIVAFKTSLSMEFSRQEYWNRLPCPPPGALPDPGIKPVSLMSPALAGGSYTTSTTWEAPKYHLHVNNFIYISILDIFLEFQNFIYTCHLKFFTWGSTRHFSVSKVCVPAGRSLPPPRFSMLFPTPGKRNCIFPDTQARPQITVNCLLLSHLVFTLSPNPADLKTPWCVQNLTTYHYLSCSYLIPTTIFSDLILLVPF